MSQELSEWSERLQSWMVDSAIPLWISRGFDPATGSAYEQLDSEGNADRDCAKRVRVQARQMFFIACASFRGWVSDGAERVAALENYLARYATHPNTPDVYVHLLTSDDRIGDTRQDLYDLAFFLLACAWRLRAFNDLAALRKAEALICHLDQYLKGLRGGWLEGDYETEVRRQNPHMHLLEAFIALYDASGDGRWLARAGEVFALFENCFYDSERGLLLEYFRHDWCPLSETEGQKVEPGHMLEWVWLLHQYSQRSGAPVDRYTRTLYDNALSLGQEKTTGLIYDAITPSGKIHQPTKRCWPITELIKASLCQATHGDTVAEQQAAHGIRLLFEYYFSPSLPGLYIDQLDKQNQVINHNAPASTLYHLMVATTEVIDHSKAAAMKRRARQEVLPS
ncbi:MULTISPECIES: AGE family epimerase/isomerase [unclassified Microbulbifer]|uniref:AGE family epimerase/isomerase n=1 Tax=unclassified Microbulbifer TaxID=2619833 RepID=UPI0027E46DAA|nr:MULTISPECIES: AGE family epimerase/isomerase [unclassified Microbulbifer]